MAVSAESDQVRVFIRTLLAAQLLVVDVKILSGTTDLASPTIATQDLLPQTFVRHRIQPKAGGFGVNHSQDAF